MGMPSTYSPSRDSRGISGPPSPVRPLDRSLLVARLVEILEEELRLEEALLDLGRRKRDALVRMDAPAVDKANREEQALLTVLAETGAGRLKILREAAAACGVPEKEATVRGLAGRLSKPESSRLMGLAQRLQIVLQEVRRINDSNRKLTEQSLQYVRDFFEIVSGATVSEKTYGRRGQGRTPPARLMIDQVA